MENAADPMVLFFERQGLFLTTRQMDFCRFMLKYGNEVKAAKMAEYPLPDTQGRALNGMFGDVLDLWRKEINFEYNLASNVYVRMAQAENTIITNADQVRDSDEPVEPEYEQVPNYNVQKQGADGICKMYGFNAAEGLDINMNAEVRLPASTREMIDNAYKQAGSE